MAEGTHRPGGEPPRSEHDLLADRRARRASEVGESALVRRAEVAEATVQTLETHLASLQQRVRDAEEESRRMVEDLQGERSPLGPEPRAEGPSDVALEYELRRARQRSHVERQLRIEAEDRYVDLERESRAEIDRLSRRLAASEREVQELAGRLDAVQLDLEHARLLAAGRGAAEEQADGELHRRLSELERSAAEIERGLALERDARAESEQLVESMRESHRQVQALVSELQGSVARLSGALSREAGAVRPAATPAELTAAPGAAVRHAPPGEMADALAAAVVRLRERAEDAERPGEVVDETPAQLDPALRSPTYKHSLSLVGRVRLARKQRRARR